MTNREFCFMMFLRFNGDSGFSSRSSFIEYEEFEEFMLSNGQIDSYPKNWTVTKDIAKNGILEFYKTENKPTSIAWFEN